MPRPEAGLGWTHARSREEAVGEKRVLERQEVGDTPPGLWQDYRVRVKKGGKRGRTLNGQTITVDLTCE